RPKQVRSRWSMLVAAALIPCATLPIAGQTSNATSAPPPTLIAAEMDSIIDDQLAIWYPRVIDEEHGGFLSRFDYKWELDGSQDKMIVTQARHVWSTATVAESEPEYRHLLDHSYHGYEFLRDVMW